MAVPTRIMERKEFGELLLAEGGAITAYSLAAVPFAPPNEDGTDGADYGNYKVIHLMFLNTAEPRIYRDQAGVVFVIIPKFEILDYAYCQDIHPIQNEWCYRLAPGDWIGADLGQPLIRAAYIFDKTETLAPFESSNVLTH